jgi:HAD superfamily hydrolase (TIGR01549 family)
MPAEPATAASASPNLSSGKRSVTMPSVRTRPVRRASRARSKQWVCAKEPLMVSSREAAYDVLRAPDAWQPYPDTAPVLRALRDQGMRIGIVSDFAWDLRVHLAHHGLADLIDACVISYEMVREKPDPQLFLKACAGLGTDPRTTLMVGDNPSRDGGATACGLRAYILPAEHRTGPRGLDQVLRLVARDTVVS